LSYLTIFHASYHRRRRKKDCQDRGRQASECPAGDIMNQLLRPVYGPSLRRSACEASMSLVNRPDPLFAFLKRRMTRRVFFFQPSGVLGRSSDFVGCLDIRCPRPEEMKKFQSHDEWGKAALVASGYLRPPGHMRLESGYAIPLLGSYSSHVGLLPFECTPFVSHNSFFGYVCAQAALYMCLEMMMPWGAVPHSPAGLSHLAARRATTVPERLKRPKGALLCTEHRDHQASDGYYCRGLHTKEMQRLLDDEELGTQALEFTESAMPHEDVETTVFRHLSYMLQSRIPTIAVVDYYALAREVDAKRYNPLGKSAPHVITVVGTREQGKRRDIVFHDGHLGPYREISLEALVSVARAAPKDAGGPPAGELVMMSPLPRGLSDACYTQLLRDVVADTDLEGAMTLRTIEQVPQYLSKYDGGHPPDPKRIRDLLKPIGDSSKAVWLVERVARRKRQVYVELVDARTSRRVGVFALGADRSGDPWRFARTESPAESGLDRHLVLEIARGKKIPSLSWILIGRP
jgi:hypothetical protein